MGLASGSAPLPYGHSAEAAIDIEGLAVSSSCVSHTFLSHSACIAAA